MADHLLSLKTVTSSPLVTIGAIVTAYYLLKISYSWLHAIRTFFLSSGLADVKKYGSWAVVTGATDGIGKAYAEQLAAKGLNIVLISRSLAKLQGVSVAIEQVHGVKTKVIVADFSHGLDIYSEIGNQLRGLDVGILVNNVGMGNEYPEYFHLVPSREEVYAAMINCNILSVTQMTSLLLPEMLEKKMGVIINISSLSGIFYSPLLAVYSATKSFVATFTRSLQVEYASKGVIIQHVAPAFVVSNLSKVKKPSFFIPSAMTYVRCALATLGAENDTYGYFGHWLQSSLMSLLPTWLCTMVIFRLMSSSRARALRKVSMVTKRN